MLEQLSFTDFLYLPNGDKKTQEQIIDNYKGSYQKLEREFEILCERLSTKMEASFFEENPAVAKFVLDVINGEDTFLRLGYENGFFKQPAPVESDSDL